MKLFLDVVSAVALATAVASVQAAPPKRSNKKAHVTHQFMVAMHSNDEIRMARRKSAFQQAKKAKFFEKLVGSSRKLNNGNYYYGGADVQGGQYNYNPGEDQYGEWVWGQNQYGFDMDVAFDMTSRSFKYAGCAAIKSFDSDLAEQTGDSMTMETYAVFRLCPADSCNKFSLTGCGKNYGEYAVEMKIYLQYVLDYYQERFDEYCEYCLPCDYDYQQETMYCKDQCYAEFNTAEANIKQQKQDEAWQQYYSSNNGDMAGYNAYNFAKEESNYNEDEAQKYYNCLSVDGEQQYNYWQQQNDQQQNGNQYNQQNGNQNYNYNQQQEYNQYNQNDNAQNDNLQQFYQSVSERVQQCQQVDDYNNRKLQGYYDENGEWVSGDNANGGNNGNQNGQFYYGGQGGGNDGYWGGDGTWYQLNGQNLDDFESDTVCTCQSGTNCDLCEWENEQLYGVCDDYVCKDYYSYCSDFYGSYEDKQKFDVGDFLECQPYENEETEEIYYLAPHCGSDHYTISLGVFSDENCANFVGKTVTLASVLGYSYNDDDLFKIPKDCISCDGVEEYLENVENDMENEENTAEYMSRYNTQYGNEHGGDGQQISFINAPTTDADGAVAMCSALYKNSAQCDMHMEDYDMRQMYMTSYELQLQERYCAFIDNIVYGAFDEQGEIQLKGDSFNFAEWRNPQQYKKLRLPASQALGLAVSAILCISLAAYAAFTQRSIVRRAHHWRLHHPQDLDRVNSGVILNRLRSGPSNAMVI